MKKIGKYEILEKIGVGGFGEVFKGKDPFIKRFVAIKTCTAGDQETKNRFFQEAEIAGKLNHRNITTVYDFGVEDTLPFLIQEYLSGEDLDRKIKRRDYIPYPEKLHYLIQIARGLAYAHRHGVIHRDIKPANVRVLEDGTVKIMDFGIAKLAQQETNLTRTGMTVGTAAYLPPEQIRGEPVDHRTDVFSFGVLAYELLTYTRPFQGEQISAVIYEILNREPRPIRETWPTAPLEVVELIARCLAKEPAERFPDGSAVLRFLEIVQERGREQAPGDAPAAPEPAAPRRASGSVETRELPQEPPALASPAAPPARPGGERRRKPGPPTIDEFELTSVRLHEPGLARSMPVRGAAAARPSPLRRVVLMVILPILALAAGWGLGDQHRRAELLGFLESLAGRQTPEAEDAEGPADPDQGPETQAGQPDLTSPPASPTDAGGEPPSGDGDPAAAPAPPPPVPEPPPAPPPPPPPEPGRIVVAKVGWSDLLTVRVGTGRRYPLTSERSFPLPPGTYSLVFELQEPDYQASETVRVEVRENERRSLESPIGQPGALSVRAGLGKPQGKVLLSGEDLGSTPISRKTAPGDYRLRILPLAGEGGGIEQGVVVLPGQETVLTFDLEAGSVSDRVKPLDSR